MPANLQTTEQEGLNIKTWKLAGTLDNIFIEHHLIETQL